MRDTIDFGIYMSTAYCSIAVLEGTPPLGGTHAVVIKNNDSMEYTPSVVWIDRDKRLIVGRVAKQRLEQDPRNVKAEFMLQMGSDTRYRFESSGQVMKPEDLTAEVFKSLRRDVQQRLGEEIHSAVITVPAAFELPQCDATRRAAQLAGLQESPLIMEPTAAAMAHAFQSKSDKVYWLVYDLGGGTFDAAVIQIKDGVFRIVNHAGDNHLGGKLIIWEIVDKLLAPAAAAQYHLSNFTHLNPQWKMAFAKLKYVAEEAVTNLSIQESDWITVDYLCKDDSGEPLPFEYELKRSDLTRLARPFIQRSIHIARQALVEAKLGISTVEKVILVGEGTLAPHVRQMLEDPQEGLGIPLDFSVDPLTVVAQGAAIFAGTQRLEGRVVITQPPGSADEIYAIRLEYDPTGMDHEPLVGGKVIAPAGQDLQGFGIEFLNTTSKPAWRSGRLALSSNGTFVTTLWAQRGNPNVFTIQLTNRSGRLLKTQPAQLVYTLTWGGDPPVLIHSIGLVLPNNRVDWFLEKGAALPARQRRLLHLPLTLPAPPGGQAPSGGQAGNPDEALRLPVVEGDSPRADRNRLIGMLVIQAAGLPQDLPIGTEIEITIEIDAERTLTTSAYIPLLDLEFRNNLDIQGSAADPEKLREELTRQRKRLLEVRRRARETGNAHALVVLERKIDGENMVENVQTALDASRGDPDAANKAHKRLLDLTIAIDQVEEALVDIAMLLTGFEEQQARLKEILLAALLLNLKGEKRQKLQDLRRQAEQARDAAAPITGSASDDPAALGPAYQTLLTFQFNVDELEKFLGACAADL